MGLIMMCAILLAALLRVGYAWWLAELRYKVLGDWMSHKDYEWPDSEQEKMFAVECKQDIWWNLRDSMRPPLGRALLWMVFGVSRKVKR